MSACHLFALGFLHLTLVVDDERRYYKAVTSLPLMFASMIFVGLLGGASYVNVFYLLLKDPAIPEQDREFTIQIAAVFGPTLGITLSSLSVLAMDNTFLLHS